MTSGTTPVAGGFQREASIAWSMLIEALLVVAAIAVLFPWFAVLATHDSGRDDRFADSALAVRGLSQPILPKLCPNFAVSADAVLRDSLCGRVSLAREGEPEMLRMELC